MRILLLLGLLIAAPARAQSASVLATLPHRGAAPGAPVVVVEVADFECPFCVKVAPALDQLLDAHPTQIVQYFLDYPMPFHTHAARAHEAAACAHRQGRFWDLYSELYAKTRSLEMPDLVRFGRTPGMDTAAYVRCVDERLTQQEIGTHAEIAKSLGVTGVPTVFLNGEKVSGAMPYATFEAAYERALARPAQGASTPRAEEAPLLPEAPPQPAGAPP